MNTRDKIKFHCIKLFNKRGYGSVNLMEIAQSLGISRGNLTYHFKTKEDLLLDICADMWRMMEVERSKSRQLPSFENLHNEFQRVQKFQREYAFIFLDTHVINHDIVKKKFSELSKQVLNDNKAAIAFSIEIGHMKKEPSPGLYDHISLISWMLSFFSLAQERILEEMSIEDLEKVIWNIMMPHFTDKGLKAFIKFFGQDYFDSLGDPFEYSLDQLITF